MSDMVFDRRWTTSSCFQVLSEVMKTVADSLMINITLKIYFRLHANRCMNMLLQLSPPFFPPFHCQTVLVSISSLHPSGSPEKIPTITGLINGVSFDFSSSIPHLLFQKKPLSKSFLHFGLPFAGSSPLLLPFFSGIYHCEFL